MELLSTDLTTSNMGLARVVAIFSRDAERAPGNACSPILWSFALSVARGLIFCLHIVFLLIKYITAKLSATIMSCLSGHFEVPFAEQSGSRYKMMKYHPFLF